MMRKLIFILMFLAGLITLSVMPTRAATTIEKSSQTWRCLKGTDSNYALTWHDPPSPPTLTQSLSGDGFIDERDIYIVGCMPGNNTVCSTGESNSDQLLFGKDNKSTVLVTISGGSKKYSKGGKLSATAVVSGVNVVTTGGYAFYGVMLNPSNEPLSMGMGALQQGTFTFTGTTDLSKCVKISWTHFDPFGIVFDSRSLEPLPNVSVTILDSNKRKLSLVGFPNPQVTKEDGVYNFLVEPGDYYLEIDPLLAGYTFIDTPVINKNYSKIYYKADGSFSLYKPNEIIHEIIDTPEEQIKGMPDPERRDIPLDPGNNPPFVIFPTIMRYGVTRLEDQTEIEGKTSHPFTNVTITQNDQIIGSQETDRQGFFDILINNAEIKQDVTLILHLSKKDLTGNLSDRFDVITYLSSLFSIPHLEFSVQAQTVQLGGFKIIQPIFPFLKGYAYDKKGEAISKADIAVKLAMTDYVYYRTKADQNGYFDIPSENLPIFNYNITASSPFLSAPVTYSTSEFAKSNKTYLASNNINLMKASTNKKTKSLNPFPTTAASEDTSTKSAKSLENFPVRLENNGINQKTQNSPLNKNESIQNRTTTLLVLALFLIVSIVLLGIVAYFLIRRKMAERKNLDV